MRIVKQNWFKNLDELHKEWTEAGVKASRATPHRRVKEFGYSCRQRHLTWAKEKKNWTVAQWFKVLFSDESKFCFHLETKVLESGGRVEKLIAQVSWSPVLSFHSLWCLGCNVICWCWSIVFFENQHHCTRLPRNVGALYAAFCWTAFLRYWFHFPAGFGTCPHCQKHQKLVKWPWCWCAWLASKLTRPEPHRESMRYCQEGNEKQETKNADELKATVKETWAFIPPHQCHKLITSMPRRIEAVIKAKGAPTKY